MTSRTLVVATLADTATRLTLTGEEPWVREAVALATDTEPALVRSVHADLSLRGYGDSARVQLAVSLEVVRPCDRCGEPIGWRFQCEQELAYAEDRGADEAPRELTAADLDIGYFHQGKLDLGDVLSEHVALSLPEAVTCDTPDTRVIEVCNREIAQPDPDEPVDSRFAALKGLKLKP